MASGNATRTDSSAKDWGKWHQYRTAHFGCMSDTELVSCRTCGRPTPTTGTKLCDGCWEVEHRLAQYLRDGGVAAHVFLARAVAFSLRERGSSGAVGAESIEIETVAAALLARDFGETIDNVRRALGQDVTHQLVVADDVRELVEAVELCASDGGCRALKVLKQIRARGHVEKIGSNEEAAG